MAFGDLMGSSSMGTPSALNYRAALPDISADTAGNEGSADIFSPEAEMRALRANRRVNEAPAQAISEKSTPNTHTQCILLFCITNILFGFCFFFECVGEWGEGGG